MLAKVNSRPESKIITICCDLIGYVLADSFWSYKTKSFLFFMLRLTMFNQRSCKPECFVTLVAGK